MGSLTMAARPAGRSAQLAEVNTVSPSHINNTNTIQSVVISPIAGL